MLKNGERFQAYRPPRVCRYRNCNPARGIQKHVDRIWGSKGYEVVIAGKNDDIGSAVHLLEFPCELDYEEVGLILGDKNLAFIVRNKFSYLKTVAFHHLNDHLDKPRRRPPHAIGKLLFGSCYRIIVFLLDGARNLCR